MADIASLGFAVNTSDLDKGVASLETFKKSSKGVADGLAQGARNFAAAVAGMNKGIYAMVSATKGATTEQIRLAKESSIFANNVYKSISAQEKLVASTNKVTQALKTQTTAMAQVNKTSVAVKSVTTPKPANVNTFNTANIAAQFQDIGVTAAMGQSPLTVALQQGTQLSAIINTMESPLQGLKMAFTSILNPISLMSIGLTGIVVALIQNVKWVKVGHSVFNTLAAGFDFLADNAEILTEAVLALTLAFTIANAGAITSFIINMTKAGTAALVAGGKMAVAWVMALSPLGLITVAISVVTVALIGFGDKLKEIFGFDLSAYAKAGLNKLIGLFTGTFNSIVVGAEWAYNKIKGIFTGEEGESLASLIGKEFDKSMNFDYIGKAADTAKNAFEGAADGLRNYNFESDKLKKHKDVWKEITDGIKDNIAQLQLQKQTLGLNVYETELLTQKYELFKQAREGGLKLTPEMTDSLNKDAEHIAKLTAEVDSNAEAFDFAKDASKGFFSDMRQGLQDGQSAWETFGDAVNNVLDKMIDKIMDVGVDLLFSSFNTSGAGGAGGSGSGFFDSVLSLFSAKGNVFANDNVTPFAKGGSFTNGIYDKPTMFKFANGGKFGVMGETGNPEAVMPLQRGSDGSLGVRASGGGNGGGNVYVNVENNVQGAQATVQQQQTSQGVELKVMIDQMTAENLSQQGSYSNRSFNNLAGRQLIRRG